MLVITVVGTSSACNARVRGASYDECLAAIQLAIPSEREAKNLTSDCTGRDPEWVLQCGHRASAVDQQLLEREHVISVARRDALVSCFGDEDGAPTRDLTVDPVLPTTAFALGGIAVLGLLAGTLRKRAWKREAQRIRTAVIDQLDAGNLSGVALTRHILALVPCHTIKSGGQLGAFRWRERVWLCFLDRGLLVQSATRQGSAFIPQSNLRKLFLRRNQWGRPAIGIDTEGMSTFALDRLEDIVRIVNILREQQATLRYLEVE